MNFIQAAYSLLRLYYYGRQSRISYLPAVDQNDEFVVLTNLIDTIRDLSDELFLFDPSLNGEASQLKNNDFNLFGRATLLEIEKSSTILAHRIVSGENVSSIVLRSSDFLRLLPVLFSVRSRSCSSVFHISVTSNGESFDLSCLVSIKDLGIGTLFSGDSLQDIQDMAVIAHLLSHNNKFPMIHCLGKANGNPTTYTKEFLLRLLTFPEDNEANNENDDTNINLYLRTVSENQQSNESTIKAVEKIFCDFEQLTSRSYRLFEEYGNPTAKLVIVTSITNISQLQLNLNELRVNGKDIRVIVVRLYRPWATNHFLQMINNTVEHIAVLEQTAGSSFGFECLYHDVVSSLVTSELFSNVNVTSHSYASYITTTSSLSILFEQFSNGTLENHGEVLDSRESDGCGSVIQYVPDDNESTEAIKQYYTVLQQVLGTEQSEIFAPIIDTSVPEGITETTSAEYAFGLYLQRENQRKKLIDWVNIALEENTVPESLVPSLRAWYNSRNDISKSVELSKEVQHAIEYLDSEMEPNIRFLRENQSLLVDKFYWIVGSEAWAYDIMASGIHTILKANRNINLLVVNTSLLEQNTGTRRKDLGLYAMNYGTSFVASIAAYGSYSQMVRVISEANEYQGPSVVLAYSPILNTTVEKENNPKSSLFSLTETKKAIDSGLWPLYRYNPRKQSPESFELDSTMIKSNIEAFLKRENQLSLLANEQAQFSPLLTSNLHEEITKKQATLVSSYEALLRQMQAPDRSFIVLYGSDGGRAEDAAKRLGTDATAVKYTSRVFPMNDISWEQVVDEESIILFVVSTAGQGEFPSNCKAAWKLLEETSDSALFQHVKFAVFALGDSHYWPKPEEKGFYCKPGRDIDIRVEELGGERILPLGLGDDQDDDGWETGFSEWRMNLWEKLGCDVSLLPGAKAKVPADDDIKVASNFLRGTIAEGLQDRSTLALSYENTKLTKFHGIYQQDDRDLREQRRQQGLEKAFSFMVRIRAPAGVCTPAQWQMVDKLASTYGNDTFKLTTRQAVQLHGILKFNLKESIQIINRELMDTLAACGDVNRNVMCNPNPSQSHIFEEIHKISCQLSEHLTPRTSAYHEIWLDKKKVAGDEIGDIEPLYGPTYLPRKFKIAIAVPPYNDVDVQAHCLGYIAIIENDKLVGFNVTIGGGMGMTHNNTKTFPRLGDLLGFCIPEQAVAVSEAVLIVQRDHGDRVNRKHARLKYTLEDHGLPWFREQVENYLGWKLEEPRPYKFTSNGDRFGWQKGVGDYWHFTLWVENGRIRDVPGYALRTALLELSKIHTGEFRITANQNIIISNVKEEQKANIEALFAKYKIDNGRYSGLRLNSVACVALPTCGLALAESERYLPVLIDKLDDVLDKAGLRHDAITIRMSGCPNGCSRPYVAEIALVGRAPGIYNLYLGGGFSAERLCKLYRESVTEDEIMDALTPLFELYATQRNADERFGDFVIRKQIVKETLSGNTFHEI